MSYSVHRRSLTGIWAMSMVGLAPFALTSDEACGYETVADVPSPSGRLRTLVFVRDCGAPTGFSTQVTVLPAGAKLPNESGNLFVADTNQGAAPSGRADGPEVTVRWRSESELSVAHHPQARVFLAKPRLGDIQVD
jgi:hypothetical protein